MKTAEQELATHPVGSIAPETEACLEIARTHCQLQREFNKVCKEHEATPQQYGVLSILHLNGKGGLACQDVTRRLANPAPDVTRLIDRLVRQRWVRRRRQPDDRRVVMVELTERAEELVERIEPELNELHRQRFGELTEEELAELVRLLRKVRSQST
jgi:DNA-binding MarR family transcriptional regulator